MSDYTLEDLLPHREAMLLIGEILEVDRRYAKTLSKVAKTWPTADQEGVSSLVLIEIAAQTAGVCNRWEQVQTEGPGSEKMGWLVAVKRADFYVDHLPFGLQITATTENSQAFDKLREVNGQLHHEGHLLADVVLQLYQA